MSFSVEDYEINEKSKSLKAVYLLDGISGNIFLAFDQHKDIPMMDLEKEIERQAIARRNIRISNKLHSGMTREASGLILKEYSGLVETIKAEGSKRNPQVTDFIKVVKESNGNAYAWAEKLVKDTGIKIIGMKDSVFTPSFTIVEAKERERFKSKREKIVDSPKLPPKPWNEGKSANLA